MSFHLFFTYPSPVFDIIPLQQNAESFSLVRSADRKEALYAEADRY